MSEPKVHGECDNRQTVIISAHCAVSITPLAASRMTTRSGWGDTFGRSEPPACPVAARNIRCYICVLFGRCPP
jgi:hypothetical protein